MSDSSSIGVLDSGMGGISVLNEMRQLLPCERFLYVADSRHMPYGLKPPEYIQARCDLIARFLIDRGVKALVLACNTATAAAVRPDEGDVVRPGDRNGTRCQACRGCHQDRRRGSLSDVRYARELALCPLSSIALPMEYKWSHSRRRSWSSLSRPAILMETKRTLHVSRLSARSWMRAPMSSCMAALTSRF